MKKLFLHRFVFLLAMSLGITFIGLSQDLEDQVQEIKKRVSENPLKVSGSLGLFANNYISNIDNPRAAPFSGRVLAAINFDLLGIKAPFTMALSTGGRAFNYTLPAYSFVGISPSYKWATLHLGDRSLDLGKYTFSRQSFKGVGIELKPKVWRFKAFYGRIRRAKAEDFRGIQRIEPYFQRVGGGIQAGYENKQDKILISLFKAWDKPNSITPSDSTIQVFAGENVIVSILASKQLMERLFLEAHVARSGFTENVNDAAPVSISGIRSFFNLLDVKTSTRWGTALYVGGNYKLDFGKFTFGYEWIDPGYKTMGALYFQNDIRNITTGMSIAALKRRLSVSGKIGVESNNLNGKQANQYNRLIGSIQSSFAITNDLNIQAGYSSFNNVNRRTVIEDPLNPVPVSELVLSNKNAQVGLFWSVQNTKTRLTSLQIMVNFSSGQSILNDEIQADNEVKSINTLLYAGHQILPTKWTFGASLSRQTNQLSISNTSINSIGITAGKQLLDDKMNIYNNLSLARSTQEIESQADLRSTIVSNNLGLSYQLNKKNALSFNSNYIRTKAENTIGADPSFYEFRNSVSYQIRF